MKKRGRSAQQLNKDRLSEKRTCEAHLVSSSGILSRDLDTRSLERVNFAATRSPFHSRAHARERERDKE